MTPPFVTTDHMGFRVVIHSSLGDINDDNLINVLDIIMVVNMILGEISPLVSADLNLDGIVNVVDVIQLINIILN